MSTVRSRCALTILFASVCLVAIAADETSSKRSTKSSKKNASEQTEEVKVTGRLPRYFASLVDDEQRIEIYEIQASYQERIAELEKELAELEAAQMEEVEEVLTSTQLKKLTELRESGQSKSRKTSSKSKTSSRSKSKPSKSSTRKSSRSSDDE